MDIKKLLGATALAFMLTTGAAAAQTTTDTTATDAAVGTPNTGAGGAAVASVVLLGTAGVLAVGSGLYLARRKPTI